MIDYIRRLQVREVNVKIRETEKLSAIYRSLLHSNRPNRY